MTGRAVPIGLRGLGQGFEQRFWKPRDVTRAEGRWQTRGVGRLLAVC